MEIDISYELHQTAIIYTFGPLDWGPVLQGFKRYLTQPVKELVQDLVSEEDRKEEAVKNIMHGLLARFCETYTSWLFVIRVVAGVFLSIVF